MKKNIFFMLILLLVPVSVSAAWLSWDPVGTNHKGFKVFYTLIETGETWSKLTTETQMDLETIGLIPGKAFRFEVAAWNDWSESGRSESIEYTRPPYVPSEKPRENLMTPEIVKKLVVSLLKTMSPQNGDH